ncbi:phosphoglycerate mutase, putative [Plasmodium vivax]|uniref:Phosphoglycerate mutase, putative n=1 Tax=Plasmodium vivax TaxID=5855 RepID=A0A1G4GWQ0_PLAVI|nr:phosphoglycerate mutase, putative [Plasmodium vivax]
MKGSYSYERSNPGNWNTNAQAMNRRKLNVKNGRSNDMYNYNAGVNKCSGPRANTSNDKKKGFVNEEEEEEEAKGKAPQKNVASYHYVDHGYYNMGNANNASYAKQSYYNQAYVKFPNGKGAGGNPSAGGGYGGGGYGGGGYGGGGYGGGGYGGGGYGGGGYSGGGYGGNGYGGNGYGGNGYGSYGYGGSGYGGSGYAGYGNYGNHGNHGGHSGHGGHGGHGGYDNYEGHGNFSSQYGCYEGYSGYGGGGGYNSGGYNNSGGGGYTHGGHHQGNNNHGGTQDAHNHSASNYASNYGYHSYGAQESGHQASYEHGGAKYHHYHHPHKGNEVHVKYNELISDVYYKSSYYLKKNRKYMQKLLKTNCVINIFLVRHMEADHNREVLESKDKARDLIYKDIKYLDCKASEQGKQMCEDLKNDANNRMYQKIMQLYNDSLQRMDVPPVGGADRSGASNKGATIKGASNPGASNQGASNQGASNQGASNQGASNQGASNQGASNQGASNQGASNQGASNQGASNQGDSNQGASNPGASNPGASNQGASNQGASNQPSNSAANPGATPRKGILERNSDFVIISSPLRRCLETMKYYFNFKRNILVYESVREMAGNYFSDQRSKTSEVKKFCESNFEDYEVICFGENDILFGEKFRESSDQVYCRCLQFLKMAHALAVNYFASLERDSEEAAGEAGEDLCGAVDGAAGEVAAAEGVDKSVEEVQVKREVEVEPEGEAAPEVEVPRDTQEGNPLEKESQCGKSGQGGDAAEGDAPNGVDTAEVQKNPANENQPQESEKERVFNIVLVSHSSFISHFLALLDYFNLDERNFNNCEIRKVTLPLSNTFLFFNNVVNMQLARPLCTNNFPLVFRNKNKVLKKAFKDKNIYTLSTYNDFDEMTCQQPCTLVIYQYAALVKEEKYQKYLEKVKSFVQLANKEHEEVEQIYSNGMFKNYVKKEKKEMGRSILVTDASEHLLYVPEKNAWEVNRKGFFVGQNVVIIVLPDVEPTASANNPSKSKDPKDKSNELSLHMDSVIQVVNNYKHVQDLIKSKDFWKVLKDSISHLDLNTFQEYLIGRYTKVVTSEEADSFCYLDLASCLESKTFMEKFQDRCNGYLKRLKERCDAFAYVDLEQECRHINENLLTEMFPREYPSSGVSGRLPGTGDRATGKEDALLDERTLVRKKFMCIPRRAAVTAKVAAQALFGHSNQAATLGAASLAAGGGEALATSKNFLQENINTLKSFPQSIQNLNVEMFYRDHFFYFHCLHRFIKSKNKVEGLIISKLLTFLDLLRAFDVSATNKIFQKLSKLEGLIENNTSLDEEDRLVNTYSCDKKCAQANNTSYYDESARKYKAIQTLRGRKKGVVDDLNYMRYNLLTVSGGAENVFILNVLK